MHELLGQLVSLLQVLQVQVAGFVLSVLQVLQSQAFEEQYPQLFVEQVGVCPPSHVQPPVCGGHVVSSAQVLQLQLLSLEHVITSELQVLQVQVAA